MLTTRLSRFPTALAYLKLLDIKSDQQLFEDIQPLYYERRSKVISMFSMRTLKSVQFARFTFRSNGLVDCTGLMKFHHNKHGIMDLLRGPLNLTSPPNWRSLSHAQVSCPTRR